MLTVLNNKKAEKAKLLIRQIGSVRRIIKAEMNSKTRLPLKERLDSYLKGYYSKNYIVYDLKKKNSSLYVNDIKRDIKTIGINEHYNVLNDKILFQSVIGSIAPLPELYGVIINGNIIPQSGYKDLCKTEDIIRYAEEKEGIVLKPYTGGGGISIIKITVKNEIPYINNEKSTLEEMKEIVSKLGSYMITRLVHQARYAEKIFSGSANCIRILTMKDPDNGEVFIARAAHRFGSEKSIPTDNWSQGGVSSAVDIKTGELSKAAGFGKSGKLFWTDVHPTTDQQIKGVKVEHWESVREGITEIATKADFLPYVGWDVVVTNNSFRVIEGNSFSGLDLFQVHEPLLTDERIRRFYKHYKII